MRTSNGKVLTSRTCGSSGHNRLVNYNRCGTHRHSDLTECSEHSTHVQQVTRSHTEWNYHLDNIIIIYIHTVDVPTTTLIAVCLDPTIIIQLLKAAISMLHWIVLHFHVIMSSWIVLSWRDITTESLSTHRRLIQECSVRRSRPLLAVQIAIMTMVNGLLFFFCGCDTTELMYVSKWVSICLSHIVCNVWHLVLAVLLRFHSGVVVPFVKGVGTTGSAVALVPQCWNRGGESIRTAGASSPEKLNMHQNSWRPGLRPDPMGELIQRSPDPLAGG